MFSGLSLYYANQRTSSEAATGIVDTFVKVNYSIIQDALAVPQYVNLELPAPLLLDDVQLYLDHASGGSGGTLEKEVLSVCTKEFTLLQRNLSTLECTGTV